MVRSESGFIGSATVVTAESPWAAELVRKLRQTADCRIVEYGVHQSFYAMKWAPDRNHPYALYVGGGGYRKGIDILLHSLAGLNDRSWDFLFAGDAGLGREVSTANLPRTQYLGMLKWQELQNVLSKAWCIVVPTRADTGPSIVKEARVVGLPVIGSVHGGLRDYIKHGKNGLLIDPLNAENLAAGLAALMKSYQYAETLGLTFHNEDRAYFQPARTADGFRAIYRELVNKHCNHA